MATEAQILANRRNAQESTGPQTTEGKNAVSQNALKHGLTARQDVISSESQADFDLYRDRMLAELAPDTPMESMLAERIVSLSWRLKRAGLIQNQAIDALNADGTSSPLAKLTQSLFFKAAGQPQGGPSACERDLTLGRMAIKDFSYQLHLFNAQFVGTQKMSLRAWRSNLEHRYIQISRAKRYY
jgi:hypothetical protein